MGGRRKLKVPKTRRRRDVEARDWTIGTESPAGMKVDIPTVDDPPPEARMHPALLYRFAG